MFQWTWLEQGIERNIIPKRSAQFNSIHERLIEAYASLGYKVVMLPKTRTAQRADFIMRTLET